MPSTVRVRHSGSCLGPFQMFVHVTLMKHAQMRMPEQILAVTHIVHTIVTVRVFIRGHLVFVPSLSHQLSSWYPVPGHLSIQSLVILIVKLPPAIPIPPRLGVPLKVPPEIHPPAREAVCRSQADGRAPHHAADGELAAEGLAAAEGQECVEAREGGGDAGAAGRVAG